MFKWLPAEDSNRGLQVIAGLMALTLWIFVGLLPRMDLDKRRLTLPIKTHHASGSIPVRMHPVVAEVVLEGAKAAIGRITESELEVFVDLQHVDPRQAQVVPLSASGPPGVHWEIIPTEVQILVP